MSVPPEDSGCSKDRLSAEASSHSFDKQQEKGQQKEEEVRGIEKEGENEAKQEKQEKRFQPYDDDDGEGGQPVASSESATPSSTPPPVDATSEAPSESASPFRRLIGWRLVVVEFCLCLGLLLSIVDASIVATALVTIEDYFDQFFESIWIVIAYLLSYMAFSLLWARLSDVLGRKWMVVAAWCVFTAFSLGCGLAQSLSQLIAFRALQGVGGSGLYSLCNVIVPEITPPKHFATMSAATGIVFVFSSVLGPVLGGVISQHASWRWIFLINVPCGVVALAILLFTWPSPPRPRDYGGYPVSVFTALAVHVDFIGAFLLLVSTTFIIFSMEEAGSGKFAWDSPTIIACLVVAGVFFVAFAAWIGILSIVGGPTGKIPISPIIPLRILRHRILASAILSSLLTGFPLFLTIIQIPSRYQIVNATSPTLAGIRLMPLLFASAIGSTFGGICSSKKNNTFYTLIGASALMVVGCGLLSTAGDNFSYTPEVALYGYQMVFGWGLGMTFTTVTIIASTESKFQDYSIALGMVNQARIMGGVFGLASSTVILNIRLTNSLSTVLTPSQLSSLKQSLSYIPYLSELQQLAVVDSYAKSFNDQLRYCTYIAAACVIVSLGTWARRPTDLLERKRRGGELLAGRMTFEEADASYS